jgi:hypothetical protein
MRGSAELTIILILVIIFAGSFYVATKPKAASAPAVTPKIDDATKNWKTYTNSKIKLSLKYPPTWSGPQETRHEGGIEITMAGGAIRLYSGKHTDDKGNVLTLQTLIEDMVGTKDMMNISGKTYPRIISPQTANGQEVVTVFVARTAWDFIDVVNSNKTLDDIFYTFIGTIEFTP